MAANFEQLARRAQAMEKNLTQLADGDASTPELAALLQEYRAVCENIVSADFEYAATSGIETQLWAAHLKINASYRKQLRHLRRNAKDHVVEIRKLAKSYLQFIKGSQRFYRQYVMNLDAQFDGIPELRKIAQTWKNDTSKMSLRKRISASLKHQVLESCHQTLIQLGDLSRYRETELVEKDRNWGPAKGYYDLAAEIYPDSGHSHNQLAVISLEDGNHFRSTYHLYRSLASRKPHPLAKQNLELEFKKIVSAWNKGELINSHKPSDGNTAGRALVAWFIRLHSKCYKGQEFAQHDELEGEVLSHLAIELKERPLDHILQKIILINLAAEYFATVQMQSPDPPEHIMRTYFYYLRLNVKTFFTLLQVLQLELERLSEGDDVTNQNGERAPHLSDKITAVARRILPGLRLYSTWFARYWHVLNANVADTLTIVEVQELWKAYAGTLTLLASSFPANELPPDNYMLEEDTETIGFQPLVSPETMRMWYNNTDIDTTMKPKWSDLERNHPNIEMLMRVRDLLVDGVTLSQNPDAPLDLDGLRFIYHEAGLPSELLASPNNHPDGSPVLSPVIPTVPMDFPLFPQVHLPDDQKSYSVTAASDSASTTLAKDSAMNRMVDDLVGPDDGLDPLPEEDENIPPTPPAQTFEDTTLVTDTTYGLATFNISDLVNSVQNYKKPLGSPSPSQAMFATPMAGTPMARVASSSSIRQPVNLPSLPDGQYSGNSIWNRNYSGTPGPSSPLLGTGLEARGSPLNGVPTYGVSRHVRGGSSNSLRSTEYPITRPLSGGLGSGADWGNLSTSSNFGSIYGNGNSNSNSNGNGNGNGNGYIQNHFGATADVSLASPLLWGKGNPWNTDVHSPYGRTPPNGQAG